ncbi:MAG TPA: lipid II flippase MurJ [Mycobacteriales bacterium]|nr:lipid II flippase MurJ [Mycobacteriales bacterium]
MTRWGGTLLGAAAGVAGVTVLARVLGFGRTAVLARTLGPSCVGDTYSAANAVPNVVFEVVAGGALASLAVPLLAGALAAGDRERAGRTASALLTWTLLILIPVALLGVVLAPVLMRGLVGSDPTCAETLAAGTRMLRIFMPQVVLYGVGLVLTGIVQADRRFLGPALAPLLSSIVVIGTYLAYAVQGRGGLSRSQELTLAIGTTAGVAVLALSLLVPAAKTGLRLRPTLTFPSGIAARVRRLAMAGAAALVAQQIALVVALRLAANGPAGSVVVFQVATAVFLLPWAVLAVPLATTVFPQLSSAAERGDEATFSRLSGEALRRVLFLTGAAAVLLAALADLVARLLVGNVAGTAPVDDLAAAIVGFAPGLVGYGVLALASRALFARDATRIAAVAMVVGWLVVAVADIALVRADVATAAALAWGNTIGMTVAGLLLLAGLWRTRHFEPRQAAGV